MVRLVESSGDLFVNCPSHISLAHMVSLDLHMTRGIAKTFRLKFGRIPFLRHQVHFIGQCAFLSHENRYIFYLVSKGRFFHKPSYLSVTKAFQSLRYHLSSLGLTQVAIPGKICCGLDRLNWQTVKQIILTVFQGSNIEIHVYYI